MEQFLNVNQISDVLGKSPRTVHRLIKSEQLKKHKLPHSKGYFCTVEDVMAYKNNNQSGVNWFSANQASEYLGISYSSFYQLAKQYNVSFIKTCGNQQRLRYNKEDIADLEKKLKEKR